MMKLTILTILLVFSSVCFGQPTASKKLLMGGVLNKSLNSKAKKEFAEMKKAIKHELKLDIWDESGTRNFASQKRIWESKWCGKQYLDDNKKTFFKLSDENGCKRYEDKLTAKQRQKGILVRYSNETERAKEILKYSSMPGTSRHHWGTDIDINDMNPNYWIKPNGVAIYNWLKVNAKKRFGFCQVFNDRTLRNNKGYEEEKWHWSYMPVSKNYLNDFQQVTIDDVRKLDFLGSKVSANFMKEFTSSINSECNE